VQTETDLFSYRGVGLTSAKLVYINRQLLHFGVAQLAGCLEGWHYCDTRIRSSIYTVSNGALDTLQRSIKAPDLVGQVGRTHGLHTFGVGSVAGGAVAFHEHLLAGGNGSVCVSLVFALFAHRLDILCHIVDLLIGQGDVVRLSAKRIATKNTHGTGCTLSSAIAAHLALGMALVGAVQSAHQFVRGALQAGSDVQTGHGSGPLNHGFAPQPMQRLPH